MAAKHYILAFCLFPLLGCVEEIELDLPEVEAQLVVLSNFTVDQELEVSVARTRSAVSDAVEPFLYYTNADVRLWRGLDELETLELIIPEDERQTPFYRTDGFEPVVGVAYTIKVNVEGFDEVMATSIIPRPVAISAVELQSSIRSGRTEDESQLSFQVAVSFQDPPGEANFYHLRFFQELSRYRIEGVDTIVNPATTIREPLVVSATSDELPFLPDGNDQGILIRDDVLDGLLNTFRFEGSLVYNSQLYLPGNFLVELRSVSKEYYDFHASVARQQNSDGPFSSGIDLKDNIGNGVGSFAGFNTNTSTVLIHR